MVQQIPPEQLHQFLTEHPIGRAISAHTGYGPGHPVHDAHKRVAGNRPAPTNPSVMPARPPGPLPTMGAPPMPTPNPMASMGALGSAPPPQRMPMPPPQIGSARPPLPPQGAVPQGPPR